MKPELPSVPKGTSDASKGLCAGRGDLYKHFESPEWQLLWDSLADTVRLPLFLLDECGDARLMSSNACEDCIGQALYDSDLKQRLALTSPDISTYGPDRSLVAVVPRRSPRLYVVSGWFCTDRTSGQLQACPGCGRIPPLFSAEEALAKQAQLAMIARIVDERLADKQAVEHWCLVERLTARLPTLRETGNTNELYEWVAEAALELPGVEAVVVREIRGRSAYRVAVRGGLPVEPAEFMQLAGQWGRSVRQGRTMALSSPMDDPGIALAIAEPLRRYRSICCPLLCGETAKAAIFLYGRSLPIAADTAIFSLLEVLRHGAAMVFEMLGYKSRVEVERRIHNAYWELIHLAMEHADRKQLISAMADLSASLWGRPVLIRESHLPKPNGDLEEYPMRIDGQIYGFVDLPRVPRDSEGRNECIARFCEYMAVILMIHDLVRGATHPAATSERTGRLVTNHDLVDTVRYPLSPREQEIVTLISRGQSNKQIAQLLGCSESTIKTHVSSILRKMDARDRTEAAVEALKERAKVLEQATRHS